MALAAAAVCMCVWACDDTSGVTVITGEKKVSATVGREGAQLQLASGARVRIPEGALEEPVEVTLEELGDMRVRELRPLPDGSNIEAPVSLTPHRTEFKREVEIEVPLPRNRDGSELENPQPDQLRGLRLPDDEPASRWQERPVLEVRQGRAVLRSRTFSYYVVQAAGTDVSAPSGDGGLGQQDSGSGTVRADGGADSGAGSVDQGFFGGATPHVAFEATTAMEGFQSTGNVAAQMTCIDQGDTFSINAGLMGALTELFVLDGFGVQTVRIDVSGPAVANLADMTLPAVLTLNSDVDVFVSVTAEGASCDSLSGTGTLTVYELGPGSARGGVLDAKMTWNSSPCMALDGVNFQLSAYTSSCIPL